MKPVTSILLLLIALLPLQLFAQSRISGNVTDRQTKLPADYASVYINGTTNGTLTDSVGNFHLDNVTFPCKLVVSHLSYNTQSIDLKQPSATPLSIPLQLKINKIGEVSVQDKNLREENLQTFRNQFLGTNVWSKYATIENEEVIQFSRDYKLKQSKVYNKILNNNMLADPDLQWSADSTMVTYRVPANLKAISLQPLKINLPLLGYTLYYDLVGFVVEYQPDYDSDIITTLGYSYFLPVTYESERDSIRIAKNRLKTYYNSPQHFCKSLYENKLAQNGYKVFECDTSKSANNPSTSKFYYSDTAAKIDKNSLPVYKKSKGKKEVKLNTSVKLKGEYALVTDLKDQKFDIQYYSTSKDLPKDLTLFKGTASVKSEILFKSDTCIIRKDGTVPDNSIVFGLAIGWKKIASMLPDDYKPGR